LPYSVDALYDGKPVAYCPYIFVDNDAALARGWSQGYPKRLGQVFQTRYHAATGKAGPALAAGSKFAGTVTASGRRLTEAVVTLREPIKYPAALMQKPIVNLLHFPRLAADKQGQPVVHELVENVPHDVKIEQAWIGGGSLKLPVVGAEEISDLAPIRTGEGVRASLAYIVDDLKTLKDLRK
jgi:acetoacetate decarboxylase